jgi:hypothetical protein
MQHSKADCSPGAVCVTAAADLTIVGDAYPGDEDSHALLLLPSASTLLLRSKVLRQTSTAQAGILANPAHLQEFAPGSRRGDRATAW